MSVAGIAGVSVAGHLAAYADEMESLRAFGWVLFAERAADAEVWHVKHR